MNEKEQQAYLDALKLREQIKAKVLAEVETRLRTAKQAKIEYLKQQADFKRSQLEAKKRGGK